MKRATIKRGTLPRGIEILLKKASVDGDFKSILIQDRKKATRLIGLTLLTSERKMLNAIPDTQLTAIIDRTQVRPKHRAAFLGYAAAMMLATLGVTTAGCNEERVSPQYNTPDEEMEEDMFEYETGGIDPDLEYLDDEELGAEPDIESDLATGSENEESGE